MTVPDRFPQGPNPVILAHRANIDGPNPSTENTIQAVHAALERGFGIETDLRRDAKHQFYISHDPAPRTDENDFQAFASIFRTFPDRVVAMNVKELGYEGLLIPLQVSGDLGGSSFYFDFELLEPRSPGRAQRLLASLPGGSKVMMGSRLSDRSEPLNQCLAIPSSVVWADEFDKLWLTREHVEAVHAAGRAFFAISPELHGFTSEERVKRWQQFKDWGIDGLCTDYALSAREFFLP
jgi:glycerophosphoryl diester phosphodiesterase